MVAELLPGPLALGFCLCCGKSDHREAAEADRGQERSEQHDADKREVVKSRNRHRCIVEAPNERNKPPCDLRLPVLFGKRSGFFGRGLEGRCSGTYAFVSGFWLTVAYVLSTGYSLIVYSNQTGVSLVQCLVVHRSDFRYVVEIVSAVVGKLKRWRS